MDPTMHPLHFAGTVILALVLGSTPGFAQSQVNRAAPTASGLINWWRIQPGTSGGSALYDLMGGPPALLRNMTSAGTTSGWGATTRLGGLGEIRFDGNDDNLATPTNSATFPAYFSIALWMKLTGAPASDYSLLWEGVNGGGNLFITPTGRLATYSAAGFIDPAPTTLNGQTWYHIALVMTTAQLQLYINCRLDASVGISAPNPATLFFHTFGNKMTPASRFPGVMDDMKFYNRGLSQPELCTLMHESMRGEPTLLRPPLLALPLLVSGGAPSGARGKFFPFFSP
jgi:Concanavalin A-like lectin/glucanases superfamily